MPSAVAKPDSTISQRTRARNRALASCWAGSTGAAAPDGGRVMAETPEQIEQVTVESAEAGERLDRVLAVHVTALSRTRLKEVEPRSEGQASPNRLSNSSDVSRALAGLLPWQSCAQRRQAQPALRHSHSKLAFPSPEGTTLCQPRPTAWGHD